MLNFNLIEEILPFDINILLVWNKNNQRHFESFAFEMKSLLLILFIIWNAESNTLNDTSKVDSSMNATLPTTTESDFPSWSESVTETQKNPLPTVTSGSNNTILESSHLALDVKSSSQWTETTEISSMTTPTIHNNTSSFSQSSKQVSHFGLSTTWIAVTIICCCVAVALIALIVYCMICRKRTKENEVKVIKRANALPKKKNQTLPYENRKSWGFLKAGRGVNYALNRV